MKAKVLTAGLLPAFAMGMIVTLFASSASATELTPDGSGDPNGPPPMPPPMPAPGTPGSATPPPAAGSTEARLAASDAQDNRIGLKLFYLQPEIGFGFASLGAAMPSPNVANVDYSKYKSGGGPLFGLGLGAEFITFQVGARARTISTPQWNLWNVGGELMYQPGSGRFWPRFGINVGYSWAARFSDEICQPGCASSIDVGGLSVGARGGVQYFVGSNFEVGADLTFDYLSLRRSAIMGHPIFGQDGNGSGVMLGLMGHVGLHLP